MSPVFDVSFFFRCFLVWFRVYRWLPPCFQRISNTNMRTNKHASCYASTELKNVAESFSDVGVIDINSDNCARDRCYPVLLHYSQLTGHG